MFCVVSCVLCVVCCVLCVVCCVLYGVCCVLPVAFGLLELSGSTIAHLESCLGSTTSIDVSLWLLTLPKARIPLELEQPIEAVHILCQGSEL